MKVKKCFLIARTGLGHFDMRQFKQDTSTNSQIACQGNLPDKSDYFPASNIFPGPHLIKKVGT